MKSLFARIFVSFWIAMSVIGIGFTLIYAVSYPSWRTERRRNLVHDMLVLEARRAVARRDAAELVHLHERSDMVIGILGEDSFEPVPIDPELRALGERVLRTHREQIVGH